MLAAAGNKQQGSHEMNATPASCRPQVPMVIRGPGGVGRQLGAEHSQRLESYFQSIPGVQVLCWRCKACSGSTDHASNNALD